MKVTILEKKADEEDELIVKCDYLDESLTKLINQFKTGKGKMNFYKDSKIVFVEPEEVLYFESVDGRTFIYTRDSVLETDKKLYELEEWLDQSNFYRCSKSCILNINAVEKLRPEISRNITAFMTGGDAITISRRYVSGFKAIIERGAAYE